MIHSHASRKLEYRVKHVCAMAQRDAALLDLSLMIEGGRPAGGRAPLLHHLIRLYSETCAYDSDTAEMSKEKAGLQPLFAAIFTAPLLPTLLSRSSFDPSACAEPSGNNALAELLQLTTPMSADDWPSSTARLLVSHGVSVHQRNKLGRTPLLAGIVAEGRRARSAFWISLMVSEPICADLNAADDDGRTLLHWLVSKRIGGILSDLTRRPELLTRIDWFVPDKQGHTAAELAEAAIDPQRVSPLTGDDLESARCIAVALRLHVSLWRKHSKPIIFASLCSCTTLLPVLSQLVCDYLDGSGPDLDAAPASTSPSPSPSPPLEVGEVIMPLDA